MQNANGDEAFYLFNAPFNTDNLFTFKKVNYDGSNTILIELLWSENFLYNTKYILIFGVDFENNLI